MSIITGWCKKVSESDKEVVIKYSLGKNEDCDGKLIYDKESNEIKIDVLSKGASEYWTKYFICPLRSRMRRGMEMNRKYMVLA